MGATEYLEQISKTMIQLRYHSSAGLFLGVSMMGIKWSATMVEKIEYNDRVNHLIFFSLSWVDTKETV